MVVTGSPAPNDGARRRRGIRRAAGAAALGVALLGLLSACSLDEAFHFGWPVGGITPFAHRTFDLWIAAAIAALAVGVFVWGLIFWCIIRYRKRGDELPPQTRYNLPIELIYTVIPFLIISVLFYYTAVIQTAVTKNDDKAAVTVDVEAFKWNWKFSYENTKAPEGGLIYTVGSDDYIPVLVLPANQVIQIKEHSRDVIHSFWVPATLFKLDVFPGSVVNTYQTTIVSEGAYVGHCAEFCGVYHSMMNFEVRVVSPEKFKQFLDARAGGKSTPEALQAIGEEPYAVTTSPFPTKRTPATTS